MCTTPTYSHFTPLESTPLYHLHLCYLSYDTKLSPGNSVLFLMPLLSQMYECIHNPGLFHFTSLESTPLYFLYLFYLFYDTKLSLSTSVLFLVPTAPSPHKHMNMCTTQAYFYPTRIYSSPPSSFFLSAL